MARGDARAADTLAEQFGKTVHSFGPAGDQLKAMLCSNTFAASEAFTNISQFTEVVGTGYTAGGNNITTTSFSRTDEVTTLQCADTSWAQNGAGPTDVRVCVLYNSAAGAVGNDDVLEVIDLTSDGTAPVSLQAGAINVNFSTNPTVQSQATT